MITEAQKDIILKCARKYNATKVILFGGAADEDNARDIDIGVKGIKNGLFFKFYGELLLEPSEPIDVVDLTQSNSFNRLVERDGIKLYG